MDVRQVPHWIGGRSFRSETPAVEILDPASRAVVSTVNYADKETIDSALTSASQAFDGWAYLAPAKRAKIFHRCIQLMVTYESDLIEMVCQEHGKTYEDAQGSIQRAVELIEHCCAIPELLVGQYSENVGSKIENTTLRQPLGVCLGISPFNFPVMIPAWLAVPAIACGNTFILKPSEQDPSAPLLLAQLLTEAGLPDGVFNVVQGDSQTASDLLKAPEIQAVSAVGSSPVMSKIYQQAILSGKRAQTFGGAKNHAVVMGDAPLDRVARALAAAAFGSSGQRCMAVSVAVAVGEQVADELAKKLVSASEEFVVGPGVQAATEMGPLTGAKQFERVLQFIESGIDAGADLLLDGRNPLVPGFEQGHFIGPCIFDHVKPSMAIYQEEIFGPVLCIVRVNTLEEAIEITNGHTFGNGAVIFTQNGGVAKHFAHHVQAGMVGINVPIPVPIAHHAFGGWKQSVFGDIGLHGEESVRFYTKAKSVVTKWDIDLGQLAMPVFNH